MKANEWLNTPKGIVTLTSLLSMLMLWETMFSPWRPFFPVFAVLTILIPILLKSYKFGTFRQTISASWKLLVGIFMLDIFMDVGISNWLYESILVWIGRGGDPHYSVSAALDLVFNQIILCKKVNG